MVANINLRNNISSLPVCFSQVREDPELDYNVISSLNRPAKLLMIASGGDTLCRLATHPSVLSIDAVDVNKAQLDLSRFKLTLLKFSPENRLRILGHEPMDKQIRWQIVQEICRELKINLCSLGPEELLFDEGLDFCGRYEQLFKGIQADFKMLGLTIQNLSSHSEKVEEVFARYFDLRLLVDIFGKGATQKPAQEFYLHFFTQLQFFLRRTDALSCPFLNQMLFGRFSPAPYEWFRQLTRKDSELCEVNFHASMMLEFLLKSEDCNYDFIHLSNILDWLPEEDAGLLLVNAFRALKKGGKLIIRQLNSSLSIPNLSDRIIWDFKTSKLFTESDKSFFYKSILVGGKERG